MRLLLVGAGHAHLEILRRQILTPLPVELTVVSLGPLHHYSGMVPGYLQGTYGEEEIAVRIPALVERAGGRFVPGCAAGVDPTRRAVRIEQNPDGVRELPYDLVSFAVGSNTAGVETAEAAERVKPLERVVALRRRLQDLAREGGTVPAVAVGGGAAGVELSLALAAVFEKARAEPRITIVESGREILSGHPERFRARARKILAKRHIAVRTECRVVAVRPEEVELEDGSRIPFRLTVWLTGAVSWPLFRESGLPLDDRGFLWIDDALRSLGDPRIFAAGDCGTLASH
ncbi:MAG TPA: FAD-dependent oxidoreductase, partial [Thermoanaerobaculia bacterium]|nr:FAD-dependent oxidoreductase [Thermoanaerobaculia bacterium]